MKMADGENRARSDRNKKYIPLNESTLTHTAWAVDALIAVK